MGRMEEKEEDEEGEGVEWGRDSTTTGLGMWLKCSGMLKTA